MTNPINAAHSGAVVISGSAGIRWAQFLARRAALRIEVRTGLRRSGRPASVICREAYCLPNATRKQKTLDAMNRIYEDYCNRPDSFILEFPSDGVTHFTRP